MRSRLVAISRMLGAWFGYRATLGQPFSPFNYYLIKLIGGMGRSQPRFASRSRGVLGSLSRRKLFVEFERIVGTVSYVSRIAKSAKLQIICNDYCKDRIFSFFFLLGTFSSFSSSSFYCLRSARNRYDVMRNWKRLA